MNKKKYVVWTSVLFFTVGGGIFFQNFTAPKNAENLCSAAFKRSLLDSSSTAKSVSMRCSLTLDHHDVVKKAILIQGKEASGITLDCDGATLDVGDQDAIKIFSKQSKDSSGGDIWSPPENVTIKNCNIKGSVRVYGMTTNGEGEALKISSRKDENHTARAQANAPKNIVFDHVSIEGQGDRIPLYISPGVTYFTLQNSEVSGESSSVGIYFDAESGFNTLRKNYIHVDTKRRSSNLSARELIALDGSSNNTIVGNRFADLDSGGIFLYRNCGEGGTIRHQKPEKNKILSNFFYYNKYDGSNPSINVASRNGNRNYCGADDGFPWGSSANNKDFARYNVIADNQIAVRDVAEMIVLHDSPNTVIRNRTVDKYISEKNSCFYENGQRLLRHGESILEVQKKTTSCEGFNITCNDGFIEKKSVTCPTKVALDFECRQEGNNDYCQKTVSCPIGMSVVRAKAICNLEYGTVKSSQLVSLPWNTIDVAKKSDDVNDGHCIVGSYSINEGSGLYNFKEGKNSLEIACKENDLNGGDCHILGKMECE